MQALYVILGIVVLVLLCGIGINNSLIRKKNKIDEARSGIEVALTKRYDMLTKLLDVAKAYAKHEKDLFSQAAGEPTMIDIPEEADLETF